MHKYDSLLFNIHHQGFHICENFLPDADYHALQDLALSTLNENRFRNAGIGSQAEQVSNIRQDAICWLDNLPDNPALCGYFSEMNSISQLLNQHFYLGLNDFETHLAIYQPGTFYRRHIDQFRHNKNRRISCVYYLNDEWQESYGGQLKLYGLDDQLLTSVTPGNNRLLCFTSNLPHEVVETRKMRLSIAGWMKSCNLDVTADTVARILEIR